MKQIRIGCIGINKTGLRNCKYCEHGENEMKCKVAITAYERQECYIKEE